VLGELHPRWRQQWELPHTPLLFEIDLDAVAARKVPAFVAVPKFQPAERDIAVIVADGVTHTALMEAIHGADTGGLLRDAWLFDVYKPQQSTAALHADEKSLAVRLTLASSEATLTDDQIEAAVRAVVERIASQLGGRLRG
jgi:phenylalanyl-tRNA synthetase beta chain